MNAFPTCPGSQGPTGLLRLEIWTGFCAEHIARVYASLPREASWQRAQLAGTLRGPMCRIAQTLPTTFRFTDLGPGPTVAAECKVLDPCPWFPGMAYTYQLSLELRQGSRVLLAHTQTFAIRPLAATSRSLRLSSKRFVPRAVERPLGVADLPRWRELAAVPIVRCPRGELLEEALREGVPLFVTHERHADQETGEVFHHARSSAVVGAILDSDVELGENFHWPRGMLMGRKVRNGAWIPAQGRMDFLVLEATDRAWFEVAARRRELPILAWRAVSPDLPLEAARKACDQLQRDISPVGDFAGFVV